ncbi:unnamed protein product, partial [Allacma fusca]
MRRPQQPLENSGKRNERSKENRVWPRGLDVPNAKISGSNREGSDCLGGLRPVRTRYEDDDRVFEWVNGPLVEAMQQGGIFLADEISL